MMHHFNGGMAKLKEMKSRKLTWIIALSLILIQFGQAQEIALPDTPAGKMAKAFFEAFNADGDEAMREFTEKYRTKAALQRVSLDDRMAQHGQIKGMLQQLEVRQIVKSEEAQLTVLTFSEATGAWFEIGFTLKQDNYELLEGFALQPSTAPKEVGDEGYGEWQDLGDLLNKVVEKEGFPGISMAVIKDGQIKETAVAGVRKIGTNDAVQIVDRFHIGSITKSMTATLIGKLIEGGKLEGTSTLKSLFPKMKMLPVYESVTVHQLLTHNAGIPGYLTVSDEVEAELMALPGNPTKKRLAFAERVLNEEPITTPGSAFAYSNAGYAILGAISEKVSGKSWEKQLEKVVFGPLKMSTAGVGWPKDLKGGNQPIGHYDEAGQYNPHADNSYDLGAYIDPAGDVHASMEDLAKYALAHMNGVNGKSGILKAETVKWLHAVPEKRNYAAGWFVIVQDGETIHAHNGSAGTFMAMMQIYPDTNEGYVIAANAGSLAIDGIFKEIVKLYRAKSN